MRLFPDQEPDRPAATHEKSRITGFGENWNAALGLAIAEDLPVISRMVPTVVESQRNQKIESAIASGDIPRGVEQFYDGNANGLAGYARDVLGLEGFMTDDEFEENRMSEFKAMREYSQGVFSQAGKAGTAGQIAGYAHAMAVDPVYATSFLTGYGTATTIGKAALRVGVTEAAIETVAQVPKMSWKEEIGAEYSGAQAFTEIAFAGLGSAAIAALGKGIGRAFTPKDLTVGQSLEVIQKMSKENPELVPILNTMRRADPEDNLAEALRADEAIDIRKATENPRTGVDPKATTEAKVADIELAEETLFTQRQPIKEVTDEGVPRGTPTKAEPDTRHPMVKEADAEVTRIDDTISLMEECF